LLIAKNLAKDEKCNCDISTFRPFVKMATGNLPDIIMLLKASKALSATIC